MTYYIEHGIIRCGSCHRAANLAANNATERGRRESIRRYARIQPTCKWCGAKMDGGQEPPKEEQP